MKSWKILIHPLTVAGLALGLLGLLSLAPETAVTRTAGAPGLPMLRLALALVAIVALAVGVVPALKRLPSAGNRHQGRLRCVESLSLGPKHRIVLVALDNRELLLGVQGDGVTLLKDVGERLAPEVEEVLTDLADGRAREDDAYLDAVSRRSFRQLLADRGLVAEGKREAKATGAG